jgi:hypothetical protein
MLTVNPCDPHPFSSHRHQSAAAQWEREYRACETRRQDVYQVRPTLAVFSFSREPSTDAKSFVCIAKTIRVESKSCGMFL